MIQFIPLAIAAAIAVWAGVEVYKAKKAEPVAPVMGAGEDVIARIASELKNVLANLGIVADIKQLHGQVEQILVFGSLVLLEPHALEVIAESQRPDVAKKFGEIKDAIGDEPPKV